MTFYAFGLNYKSTSVATAEAFPLDADVQRELYATLDLSPRAEVMFLSTCNRKEVYLYGQEADVQAIQARFSSRANQPWPHDEAFGYKNEAAVRHVIEVACGLRSMVPGDGQIFAQMKNAYQRAVEYGGIQSVMHRLLHASFRAAKKVAVQTDLSREAASVSSAAVAMGRDYFAKCDNCTDLEDAQTLLVGTGEMGKLALKALNEPERTGLFVTNRTVDRARSVAADHGADPIAWRDRYRAVEEADFVIVATGAPEPVLTKSRLSSTRTGGGGETLFVDISMPRTVDPDIAALDGCTLYDLDDLKVWTGQGNREWESEVSRARAVCEEQMEEFVTWVFHQEAMEPAIQAIRDTFDAIREQEVERHAHRTDMNRAEVDRLTTSILQKLLAIPIVKLKNVDPESIDFVQGIQLLQALFSRPSCEDEGARSLEERPDSHTPSLSDVPTSSSVGPSDLDDRQNRQLIERALSLTSEASSS